MKSSENIPDFETAMMALGLSETLHLTQCMHLPKNKLMQELQELADYSMENPIFITEPMKWVRLTALFRAATYRKFIRTSITPLSCVQQHRMQVRLDAEREKTKLCGRA